MHDRVELATNANLRVAAAMYRALSRQPGPIDNWRLADGSVILETVTRNSPVPCARHVHSPHKYAGTLNFTTLDAVRVAHLGTAHREDVAMRQMPALRTME